MIAILLTQPLWALLLLSEFFPRLGLPELGAQVAWRVEALAAAALTAESVLCVWLLLQAERRSDRVEARLRAASGAFLELMDEHFTDWGLTPAEREVALFVVKGLSTAEIARVRGTSEGTVKAQAAAVHRKAGVSGRAQLLSLFIEDLIDGAVMAPEAASDPRSAA